MKRILTSLTLLLMGLSTALAQKGLHINEVFDGDVVEKTYMVENIIKGKQLAPYKLTVFRSIKFKATQEERIRIEELLAKDVRNATDSEQEIKAASSFTIATFPDTDKSHPRSSRYVCYQCAPVKDAFAITLVYMKGDATINELRKTFKK